MKKGRSLLRVLRAQQEPKVTQRQLALRAGLSPARYWQIESGEGKPADKDERIAVAAALGVESSEVAWPGYPEVRVSA